MGFDGAKIALAVSQGLSIVCATCTKYWGARDMMVPDGRCLATDGCGSPIAGDVFHEYKGPLPSFDKSCFMCGADATHAIRVIGNVRVVGCCATHVEKVKTLKPQGKPAPSVVLISRDGEEKIDENSPAPRQSLRFRS